MLINIMSNIGSTHGEFILKQTFNTNNCNGGQDDICPNVSDLIKSVTDWIKESSKNSSNEMSSVMYLIYKLILNDCISHILIINMLFNNDNEIEDKNLIKLFNESVDKYSKQYGSITFLILIIILMKLKNNTMDPNYRNIYKNIYKILFNKLFK